MTQPLPGSARTEVNDLRNIVDRLDLLMGSSPATALQTSSDPQVDDNIAELTARLGALEGEVEQLRTLVNHLMTIATWQAKVTATLVGEDDTSDDDADPDEPPRAAPQHHGDDIRAMPGERDDTQGGSRERTRHEPVEPPAPPAPRVTTLDDDIDEILGTDRRSSSRAAPPPDFGI
ncbi:hypothetical protein BH23ACT10_BH23ACT10_19510 [soil metagenome]